MSFMQPEIEFGTWFIVDGPMGTEYVPTDIVGELDLADYQSNPLVVETFEIPSELADYCENSEAYSIEKRDGWGARLSAPGYLDCTEWAVFDTEQQATEYLAEQYDDDSDTNLDCLSDDPSDLEAFSNDTSKPQPLRDYAALKAKAMKARLEGRIQEALGFESNCDEIYSKLPTDLRW